MIQEHSRLMSPSSAVRLLLTPHHEPQLGPLPTCGVVCPLTDLPRGLQVGDVVVGTVQSVKPYGAFVDIGGVNGLLHISQISEDRVTNVEAVLSEGDKLKVRVPAKPSTL